MNSDYSLYIHIPFCISKCSYCDFFSIPTEKCKNKNIISDDYVNALCNEILDRLPDDRLCKSIYIGGGTPSLLSFEQLKKITDCLYSKIIYNSNLEFTIECNPDDITENLLNSFDVCGVTRLSCGIQSLNDKVLKSLNRRAGRKENLCGLETIKKYWKKKLSLDLISSLPGEDEKSFFEGLKVVLEYNPHHISLYSLTIEEETPLGKALDSGQIIYDFDYADEMWIKGRDFLIQNGYKQYEISNFCREENYCIHNLTYWNHQDYIGIGCGATGTLYFDGKGLRLTNLNDIENYIKYWNTKSIDKNKIVLIEEIEKSTSIFEYFMMGLRTSFGVNSKSFYELFHEPINQSVQELFKKWQKKGLVEIYQKNDSVFYNLTSEGMLFLNTFLEELIP